MNQYLLTIAFLGLLYTSHGQTRKNLPSEDPIPAGLQSFIQSIRYGLIGKNKPTIRYQQQSKDLFRVSVQWELKDSIRQDDLQVNLTPSFHPVFNWAPHLTPTDDHIIAQHVFRSPALIVSSDHQQVILIPDLDLLQKKPAVDWYMDMNATGNTLTIGCSRSRVKEHVLFVREKGAVYPPGKIELGFYLMTADDAESIFDPWGKVLAFFWKNWGNPLYQAGEPLLNKDLGTYAGQTYNWAFNSWKKNV